MHHEGTAIRIAREAQGLSLRELAALAGVDHAYLSRVERGVAAKPSERWKQAVIAALAARLAERSVA